ncbi:MAG: hypothetical protein HY841_00845 [Bacteroidetes bacterium]|nr:hypothetical protein [Bacteroidota bacterium]
MKITKKNYFSEVKRIGFENLPEVLKKTHLVLMTKTDQGKDWKFYKQDAEFKKVADLAFEKLGEYIKANKNLAGVDGMPAKRKYRKMYHKFKEEVKYFKLLLDWRDEEIAKPVLLKTIEQLQSAIVSKKIRKSSVFAREIGFIQKSLLHIYNGMKAHSVRIQLKEATILMLREAIKKSKEYDEPLPDKSLPEKVGSVGLRGIDEQPKEDTPAPPQDHNLMSSVDFAEMKFESLGFSKKWRDLIGDPSKGFTAMVFGKPKTGKSYLCMDFAGYLARHHGGTLYVAKEEKLDATLHKKLADKEVANPNLYVSDYLPEDLSKYDFIILDSVNKLGLTPKDLDKLRADNPGKSFIFIFQTTKQGAFRGRNEFQHDVDVVIEIPEQGKAVQFGRFNQGGEMQIFEEPNSEESETKDPIY